MRQLTARTRAEVLKWMDTEPHHIASAMDDKFFVLQGYGARLRIPYELNRTLEYGKHFVPGGKFDTRMYRPTAAGRKIIARARANDR